VNILVIDNTHAQLAAAKTQLEALGHTVTCVNSFYGFMTLAMKNAHSTLRFWEPKLAFDVVLTDLFMPAAPNGLADHGAAKKYFISRSYDRIDGQMQVSGVPRPDAPEVAYGLVIAMVAAMAGAKKVGILSIGDHHDDPMAWAMDAIEHTPLFTPKENGRWGQERFPVTDEEAVKAGEGKARFTRTFVVNGATMAFFTGYACPRIHADGESLKNWAAALERLMGL